MSIERRQRQKGVVYVVWWKDDARRSHNRTFSLRRDAEAFEASIKLAKAAGQVDTYVLSRKKVAQLAEEWWTIYATPNLSLNTQRHYANLLRRHIIPHVGSHEIRRLTPGVGQKLVAELNGLRVGVPTIRKTLALLQAMFAYAVRCGYVTVNPIKAVQRPKVRRNATIRALSPETVEKIRVNLPEQRDKTLVSVLAYAGLRPGEALALTWGDVGKTIRVDKALALGERKDTKTSHARNVRIVAPLKTDLRRWQLASGRPDSAALVFASKNGTLWTDSMYRNWRRRIYQTVADSLGLASKRPYDLRHSCASLMFAEGMNPAEIAEHMGHSLQTLFATYAHVIEELRGTPRTSADTVIRTARRVAGHTPVTQAIAGRTIVG